MQARYIYIYIKKHIKIVICDCEIWFNNSKKWMREELSVRKHEEQLNRNSVQLLEMLWPRSHGLVIVNAGV